MKFFEKKLNYTQLRTKQIVFFTTFILFFAYACLADVKIMQCDASYYSQYSASFISQGNFRLENFETTFRGVAFPLLLFCFNQIAGLFSNNPLMGWRIFVSLLVATLSLCLPYFFTTLGKGRTTILARLLPVVLLLFFWYGLINYTLSDLPAVSILILGMYLLANGFDEKSCVFWKQSVFAFLAGICFYTAYNTRTIYLFPTLVFVPLLFLYHFMQQSVTRQKWAVLLLLFFLGVITVGGLQFYINYQHLGIYSFAVQSNVEGYGSLFAFQIIEGLKMSQYETFVGSPTQYPSNGLVFTDVVGVRLFGNSTDVLTILTYLPQVIGIYSRHLINMLNPVWGGGAYIHDLYQWKIHRSIINYIMLFLLGEQLLIWIKNGNKTLKEHCKSVASNINGILFIVTMATACVAILPGAVELRFFIPMYLVMYGLIAFSIDYKAVGNSIKARPILHIGFFVGIFFFLCGQWASTYSITGEGISLSIW